MISVCLNRYPNGVEPLVYSKAGGPEVVWLFDGSGSWGTGAEAAAWFRERISEMFREPEEFTRDVITVALEDLIQHLPSSITDDDFSWSFSLAVVVAGATSIQLGSSGSLAALAIRRQGVQRLFTPERLIDQLIACGNVPAAEASTHRFRNIISSPFFGLNGTGLTWSQLTNVEVGDRIVVGDAALPWFLETQGFSFDSGDAKDLRDAVERGGGSNSPTAILEIRLGAG